METVLQPLFIPCPHTFWICLNLFILSLMLLLSLSKPLAMAMAKSSAQGAAERRVALVLRLFSVTATLLAVDSFD
jgi:hypothetical protein